MLRKIFGLNRADITRLRNLSYEPNTVTTFRRALERKKSAEHVAYMEKQQVYMKYW